MNVCERIGMKKLILSLPPTLHTTGPCYPTQPPVIAWLMNALIHVWLQWIFTKEMLVFPGPSQTTWSSVHSATATPCPFILFVASRVCPCRSFVLFVYSGLFYSEKKRSVLAILSKYLYLPLTFCVPLCAPPVFYNTSSLLFLFRFMSWPSSLLTVSGKKQEMSADQLRVQTCTMVVLIKNEKSATHFTDCLKT